jgi:hypothetical protein
MAYGYQLCEKAHLEYFGDRYRNNCGPCSLSGRGMIRACLVGNTKLHLTVGQIVDVSLARYP